MVSRQLLIVQNFYLQVRGEQVPQRRLDVWQEPGLDGAFLKVLLQWSTKAESSIVTTVTSSNQVLMVVSDSSWLSRLSTLSHRSFMEFKQKLPFRRRLSVFLRGKMAGVYRRKISHYIIAENTPEVYTYSKYKLPAFSLFFPQKRALVGKFLLTVPPCICIIYSAWLHADVQQAWKCLLRR